MDPETLLMRGGLHYGAIFSIIDGTNCSPKAVLACRSVNLVFISFSVPGADPGFQVRGGAHLKKIAPSGGRREHFWGISCEKSRFYTKKNHIFSNFSGAMDPTPANSREKIQLLTS